ncbi:hypothetical protein TRVA0_007S00232 [Trichomonascus vanleenenianus]|uniref:putative transcriptional regulatory protein n=1 Tax=Trichomonascus vanleenenianus TaxID=2268995 RepID=UPI003ECA2868
MLECSIFETPPISVPSRAIEKRYDISVSRFRNTIYLRTLSDTFMRSSRRARTACEPCRLSKVRCVWGDSLTSCQRCLKRQLACLVVQNPSVQKHLELSQWYLQNVQYEVGLLSPDLEESPLLAFALEAFEAVFTHGDIEYYITAVNQLFLDTSVLSSVSRAPIVAYLHLLFLPGIPNRYLIVSRLVRMALSCRYHILSAIMTDNLHEYVTWWGCILWDRWISAVEGVPPMVLATDMTTPSPAVMLTNPTEWQAKFILIYESVMSGQFTDAIPVFRRWPYTSVHRDLVQLYNNSSVNQNNSRFYRG